MGLKYDQFQEDNKNQVRTMTTRSVTDMERSVTKHLPHGFKQVCTNLTHSRTGYFQNVT